MKQKLLFLSILLSITGCQNTGKSFNIPLFENIIEYKKDKALNEQADKDYMYNVMAGQLELNEGNTKRAIENYEKSLSKKNNDIAYTLLTLYYKENDYNNTRRIAFFIKDNNLYNNTIAENILVNLLNNDNPQAMSSINQVLEGLTIKSKTLNELEYQTKTLKDLSDILYFSKTNMEDIKPQINKDFFITLNFFYMYNESNSKGEDPDNALKYITGNIDKTNVLQNFVLFRISYIENYHVNVYKDEMIFLTSAIDNYNLDINALEKLYPNDFNAYENLKIRLIEKYKDKIEFWYFLSQLEIKSEPINSINYLKKTYSLIKDKEPTNELKEKVLNQLITRSIDMNDYKISSYIKGFSDYEDKKSHFSYLVYNMLKYNKFNDSIFDEYKGIIKPIDQNLQIAKAYSYMEKYEEAMNYLNMDSENKEVQIEKIYNLSKINKELALSESVIYNESNNNPEAKLLLLYTKLINKQDIEDGQKLAKQAYLKYDKNNITIKDFETFPIYIYALYSYENGKYAKAKEMIEKLDVENNYMYSADYGKILWKLDQKTKAKKYFKKSKSIFDSQYLNNIMTELNIKKLE